MSDDTNQLWVHLSGMADGNIFAIYPKILEEIFLQEDQNREEEQRHELENVTLPSDMEWRLKVYFRLVEKQREMDDVAAGSAAIDKLRTARRWSRSDSGCDPWAGVSSGLYSKSFGKATRAAVNTGQAMAYPWGARDLAKAARLLERPPLNVVFDDDHEMRRVYSLIYDVFRYKGVLEEALTEAGFYTICIEANLRRSLSWLLLLDQQRRRWAKRDPSKDPTLNCQNRESRDKANRVRKRSSKDSTRKSRDSSCDSKKWSRTSRDSSVDSKEGKSLRNSVVKSKVRAVRELSYDAKEAIRKARESAHTSHTASEDEEEQSKNMANPLADLKTKICVLKELSEQPSKEMEMITDISRTHECDEIKEEEDSVTQMNGRNMNGVINKDIKGYADEITAYSRRNSSSTQDSSDSVSSVQSRSQMQNAMEEAAGEIGSILKKFDEALWDNRVRIAASIAKIRIRNKALTLSDLLPPHLRDERVCASLQRDIITGWVNVFKSRSISELVQRLSELGFSYSSSRYLDPDQFRFDKMCPKFISMRPARQLEFVKSSLIADNIIVLQEREFCLGAAALCKALRAAQIHGDVAQTHGTSPKAAAYLASQLRDRGTEAGGLIVFGAGERKAEYESFLKALGATNTKVFAEGACEANGTLWAGVVAALAAPPNSYSAVADPIDLVVSRGGDLGMLEVLTESEVSAEGKNRVMKILEEQKKILRLCMSKPQIQMVVYETHSALAAENEDMVRRAVAEANRSVRELHAQRKQRARDLPRAPKCAKIHNAVMMDGLDSADASGDETSVAENQAEMTEQIGNGVIPSLPVIETLTEKSPRDKCAGENIINDKSLRESPRKEVNERNQKERPPTGKTLVPSQHPVTSINLTIPSPIDPDSEYADVKVPDCDLFEELVPSPLAGLSQQDKEGCFLALIQRKELIRMNAKYMISVAEARGLFGGGAPPTRRPPPARNKTAGEQKTRQARRRLSASQMERIAAPTQAWSSRVHRGCQACGDGPNDAAPCALCAKRHAAAAPLPIARAWWRIAAQKALEVKRAEDDPNAEKNVTPLRLPRARTKLVLSVQAPKLNTEIENAFMTRIMHTIDGI